MGEHFVKNPAATADDLARLNALITQPLPADYQMLLREMNGGEGFVGDEYVRLYTIAVIGGVRQAFMKAGMTADLLVIGSNGGGEALVYDLQAPGIPLAQVPFIPFVRKHLRPCAMTLQEYLKPRTAIASHDTCVNPELIGIEVHEIQPIIFGGDPEDPENKALLTLKEYIPAVIWWNQKYRELTGGK